MAQLSKKIFTVKPGSEVPPPSKKEYWRRMGYSDAYFGLGKSSAGDVHLVVARYNYNRNVWSSAMVGMKALQEYYVPDEEMKVDL